MDSQSNLDLADMLADGLSTVSDLVSAAYLSQGGQALRKHEKLTKGLLSSRRLPSEGWPEATIDMFIRVRAAQRRLLEPCDRH